MQLGEQSTRKRDRREGGDDEKYRAQESESDREKESQRYGERERGREKTDIEG